MSKWICLGTAAVIAGGVVAGGAYWYLDTNKPNVRGAHAALVSTLSNLTTPCAPSDDGESSEVIEPLQVENNEVPQLPPLEQLREESRVILGPGVQQPPRPDEEPGKTVRMPYADEEGCTPWFSLTPLRQMLESALSRLSLSKDMPEENPAEESESAPPMEEAQPDPAAEYHHQHQHCPYMGGCPYPYPRR